MAASRVRMQPGDRRDLIVAAAARVFAERRYDDVSTTELARACGVSRGLLSHYFPTKRDLYVAVIGRLLDVPRLPVRVHPEGASLEERVARSVADWVEMVVRSKEAWLAVSSFLGESRDEEISALLEEYVEGMVDQICDLAGLQALRERPVLRIALHGYSAFATTLTRRWLLGADLSREQIERLLRDTLTGLVRETIPAVADGAEART